jgi:glycosyltransferase involved in cell wall biosynthesis
LSHQPDSAASKLSVIVPVYNGEAHLLECLKSLASQTFADLEVLVINDGSTDGSLAIATKFSRDDPRFSVISTTNRGVSAARNTGLEAARGTYVTFVDADDWVEPSMYQELMQPTAASAYDAVAGDLTIEQRNGKTRVEVTSIAGGAYDAESIRRAIWPILVSSDHLTRDWPYRIVTKVFRREHLVQHDLRFESGLRAAQDFVFSVAAMARAESFYYAKGTSDYHYRWTAGSRTRSPLSTAWSNYRTVDRALKTALSTRPEFAMQLRLAELHGDLSALTYLYRNCRFRDSHDLYQILTRWLSAVDRRIAYEQLNWSMVPMDKRIICSLMKHRRYRAMHGLLLLRGLAQSLQARPSARRAA